MSKVTSDISMRLDGFITIPMRASEPRSRDTTLVGFTTGGSTRRRRPIPPSWTRIYASTGAVVIGKRMFDVGFEAWGDPPPFGMPVLNRRLTLELSTGDGHADYAGTPEDMPP